ncbi:tRNA(Met) cytidine acetyltransferase TmcA [Halorubrum vacuolatum]|uniref:tRNA(Met) cytidine acetyltransferase TmcA n=1 Tax=Halorubrum vacuolatum TaxID=63740 RepID=A0A238USA1_HALVU|nr:tRNA(Met) cytidine acetyltransferase TmcA [Halorubrum vacuolatum]SNR24801.1 tRNA(Met) cytidine acetyltransferase [Halorubrum vacuolatum]
MIGTLARERRREAVRANERRLIVLAGDRDRGIDAAYEIVDAVDGDDPIRSDDVAIVSTREGFRFDEYRPRNARGLLGATRTVVVVDCHERFVPNALGAAAGAVDGGGLLVLLTPDLDRWPAIRDGFDRALAVPPYELSDVTGRFRERLVGTLRRHPGIAIVDVGDGERGPENMHLIRDGRADPPPATDHRRPRRPADAAFPDAAYEACLTADQARAVRALESLADPGTAVVIESDRGRGKSSAAGLAAGSLALAGADVLVTAPAFRNAREVLERARELVGLEDDGDGGSDDDEAAHGGRTATETTHGERTATGTAHEIRTATGGRVRFLPAAEAADCLDDPDAVIVDEAAALPVQLLERFLTAPSVAFCTTVHGYEGAGRGFAVRFRERLADADHVVRDVHLKEPIRYVRGDPVERWLFDALLLDARPAVEAAVADADSADATYRALDPKTLLGNDTLLAETFGLLVVAHYRTESNDLARVLDAPNLHTRALVVNDRPVAVALLAREGSLPADRRRSMYEGDRVHGNMVPDLLTSQLRDEAAGEPAGLRVVRIATHDALRGTGFGTRLLDRIHAEFADDVDYVSVGYGATPRLLRFWRRAGYRTVHLSTTRNDTSGEHSVVMLRPVTESGRTLLSRHASAFRRRERDALSDAHREVDVDVIRGALGSSAPDPEGTSTVDLTDHEWRAVVAAAYGPGMYDVAPGAFRDLAFAALVGSDIEATADVAVELDDEAERLLVRKVLQGWSWGDAVANLGYPSTRSCMRAIGEATKPLVERFGTSLARRERDRFING